MCVPISNNQDKYTFHQSLHLWIRAVEGVTRRALEKLIFVEKNVVSHGKGFDKAYQWEWEVTPLPLQQTHLPSPKHPSC